MLTSSCCVKTEECCETFCFPCVTAESCDAKDACCLRCIHSGCRNKIDKCSSGNIVQCECCNCCCEPKILKRIAAATFCILLILYQGLVLDYYLATYRGQGCWGWVAADGISVFSFIFVFCVSKRLTKAPKPDKKEASPEFGECENDVMQSDTAKAYGVLPLGWIAWLVYSILLAWRVGIIFHKSPIDQFKLNGSLITLPAGNVTSIISLLDPEDFFGPNTLKTTIALACIIFLLFVGTHQDVDRGSEQSKIIIEISQKVTIDILDASVALELLQDEELALRDGMYLAINVFTNLNLITPFVSLLFLSRSCLGKAHKNETMKHAKAWLDLFVDVPLFVIRLVLWSARNKNITALIIKNFLGIFFAFWNLLDYCCCAEQKASEDDEFDENAVEAITDPKLHSIGWNRGTAISDTKRSFKDKTSNVAANRDLQRNPREGTINDAFNFDEENNSVGAGSDRNSKDGKSDVAAHSDPQQHSDVENNNAAADSYPKGNSDVENNNAAANSNPRSNSDVESSNAAANSNSKGYSRDGNSDDADDSDPQDNFDENNGYDEDSPDTQSNAEDGNSSVSSSSDSQRKLDDEKLRFMNSSAIKNYSHDGNGSEVSV